MTPKMVVESAKRGRRRHQARGRLIEKHDGRLVE
jgi:hypothetical protein